VHVDWWSCPLRVGDEVRIVVVDVPESEIFRPTSERSVTPATESSERERLAYLLKKYGAPA
jgi:hypothetical protein